MDLASLAALVRRKAARKKRFLVAIAGPPASGKSTIAADLAKALGASARVVPMDGFHFDDAILNARGDRPRKGAPHTFDVAGFTHLLKRIKAREPDVAYPVFDRKVELARAGAEIISTQTKYVIVEGNYLLLKQARWRDLKRLFDLTVFIKVDEAELHRRLTARWKGFDYTAAMIKTKLEDNDLPNARLVLAQSARADVVL